MNARFVKFHQVTFTHESAAAPLFRKISFHITSGWTGVVGANGAGKTTLLKLATRMFDTDEGTVDAPEFAVYCAQRTDDMPEHFYELLASATKSAHIIKTMLEIRDDWATRWNTLSHGERKRCQLAVALWLEPDVLAIDEPTNHLDAYARDLIANSLASFQGIGLLVSHDRDLLDTLCQQCLFVEPPEVMLRPGGVSNGMELAKAEQQAVQKEYALKKRDHARLHKEMVRRRQLAEQAQARTSKRGLAKHDHDAREKLDRVRVSGKDAVGGKLKRQMEGRVKQAQAQAEAIHFNKQYRVGIALTGARSQRDLLLHLPAGSLSLGEQKQLIYPELFVTPQDRIGITGQNGSGKSTLIRRLVAALRLPPECVTYVPQEIDLAQSQAILREIRRLSHEQLGMLMTMISRLGSRPQRLLESTMPSPGETRKLLLALGMTYAPHLIIMDEPTNHLDLPSIECLETALAECPCSLILVSHDRRFLSALTDQHWKIIPRSQMPETFELQKHHTEKCASKM